jgi:hypothetical protein
LPWTYRDSAGNTLILFDSGLIFLDFCNPRFVNKFHPHILLATTELRGIDSYEEALDTTFLSVLNISPCDLPITVDIELYELDLAGNRSINDFIERARCKRWDLCARC